MITQLLTRMLTPREDADPMCGCGRAGKNSPHDFIVTTPPGYGTVHSPCPGIPQRGFTAPLGTGNIASQTMTNPEKTL